MKKFPWGRAVRNLLILGFILVIFATYASKGGTSFSLKDESPIVLGLSVVEQDLTVILNELNDNNGDTSETIKNDWITSFLLQSPDAAAKIYLDYILVPDDTDVPDELCFNSITIAKSEAIPFELVFNETTPIGLEIRDSNYVYNFPVDRRCIVQKGNKYIMPHVLLGIVQVNSYADYFQNIKGYKASDFFPFDQQEIVLSLSLDISTKGNSETVSPSLEVVVAQKGWNGGFDSNRSIPPVLYLERPGFYRAGLLVFFLIMVVIIPFLNDVVDEPGGFFEIAFGLLLGLWGMHEILIPNYINSSIPIDIAIYALFILVVVEIGIVLMYEYQKRRLRILRIEGKGDLDTEHVEIENPTVASIKMTGWWLFDKSGNKFKFPAFFIKGRQNLIGKTTRVKIWTKDGDDDDFNLYWGKDSTVWSEHQDTAYLEDSNGEAVFTYNKNT